MNRFRRSTRLLAVAGLLSAGCFAGAAPAGAAAPAATATAAVRAAHLSPDTPGVDVYLTSYSGARRLLAGDAGYGRVTPYTRVTAGVYTVAMRPAGSAASSPAMLSWTVDASAGGAFTVAAVGTAPGRRGVVLRDDLRPPAAGHGRIRLIQAASTATRVDVTATGGLVVARAAPFATATGYAQVKAGTWPLQAFVDGRVVARAAVSVQPDSTASLLLLDRPGGGVALTSTVDATGAGVLPRGGVQTGGGGLAPAAHGTSDVAAVLAVLGLVILAGPVLRTRARA